MSVKAKILSVLGLIVIVSANIFSTALFCFSAQTPINHSQLFWCKFPPRHVQTGRSKLIFADNWYFLICGVFEKQSSELSESRASGDRQRSAVAKQDEMPGRRRLTSSSPKGCRFLLCLSKHSVSKLSSSRGANSRSNLGAPRAK